MDWPGVLLITDGAADPDAASPAEIPGPAAASGETTGAAGGRVGFLHKQGRNQGRGVSGIDALAQEGAALGVMILFVVVAV